LSNLIIFIFFNILLISFGKAETTSLVLRDGKDYYNLGLHLELFEDHSGKLSLKDIQGDIIGKKFKRSVKKIPNYGFSKSTIWAKISIDFSKYKKKERWLFSYNYIQQDKITFYEKIKGVWSSTMRGDTFKKSKENYGMRSFIYELKNVGSGISTFILKIEGSPIRINLNLGTRDFIIKKENQDTKFYFVFLGIGLGVFFYNLFIFFSTKSLSYLFYVLYILFSFLFYGGLRGYSQLYVFSNYPWFSNNGFALTVALSLIFLILFSKTYLSLKKNDPIGDKLTNVLLVLNGLLILSSFGLPYSFNARFLTINAFIGLISVFIISLRVIKNYRPAKYFFMAFFFFLSGTVVYILMTFGLLPNNFFTVNGTIIGNALELILLSMGLADRFNFIQEKALSIEKEAKTLQENYAKNLEKEVQIQTKSAVNSKEKAEKSEREISGLLHNMKQAVFAIDGHGNVIPPLSNFTTIIFGKDIKGLKIYDTLYKDLDKKGEVFNKVKFLIGSCIGVDSLQFDISDNLFPRKIIMKNNNSEKRHLRVNYSPIMNENEIVFKMMLVVEDVTDLELLEKEFREEKEASAIKVEKLQEIVSNNKGEIKVFIRESTLSLNEAKKSVEHNDFTGFFRSVHTLKGNSRIFNLVRLSEEIHSIETRMVELKNTESTEGIKELYDDFYKVTYVYINLSKEIFGADVDETVLASDEDYIEVSKEIFFSSMDKMKEMLKERGMLDILEELRKIEFDKLKKSLSSLQKIVDKISLSLKKELQFSIVGDDIYLDKKTTSIIKESLMHLIQNSADHGIEKSGSIEVKIKEDDGGIYLNLSDNGKGIDERVIYKRALDKGIIRMEGTEDFTKEEILNLIFFPGFSTKAVATEYSGRGVGLDVVKANITKLGGNIDLKSEKGKGTNFNIFIPKKS
jgi:signal transduction histidine kinase